MAIDYALTAGISQTPRIIFTAVDKMFGQVIFDPPDPSSIFPGSQRRTSQPPVMRLGGIGWSCWQFDHETTQLKHTKTNLMKLNNNQVYHESYLSMNIYTNYHVYFLIFNLTCGFSRIFFVHQLQHFETHRRTACQAVLWPLVPAGQDGWQDMIPNISNSEHPYIFKNRFWMGKSTGQWFRSLGGKLGRSAAPTKRFPHESGKWFRYPTLSLKAKSLEVNLRVCLKWYPFAAQTWLQFKRRDIWNILKQINMNQHPHIKWLSNGSHCIPTLFLPVLSGFILTVPPVCSDASAPTSGHFESVRAFVFFFNSSPEPLRKQLPSEAGWDPTWWAGGPSVWGS